MSSEAIKFTGYAAYKKSGPLQPFSYTPRPLGEEDVEIAITHCGVCASGALLLVALFAWKLFSVRFFAVVLFGGGGTRGEGRREKEAVEMAAVVQVAAACDRISLLLFVHTDVHQVDSDWAKAGLYPMIPGHEVREKPLCVCARVGVVCSC
jgi:hypothetical protein